MVFGFAISVAEYHVGQDMMMKRIAAILTAVVLLAGCNREESRDFFGDITLGLPLWTNGYCFLTAKLPTKIQHSGQWVYKVSGTVDGTNILLTAHITSTLRTVFSGNINVGRPSPGEYRVLYSDPDGDRHFIGTTKIGLPNQAPEDTARKLADPQR